MYIVNPQIYSNRILIAISKENALQFIIRMYVCMYVRTYKSPFFTEFLAAICKKAF